MSTKLDFQQVIQNVYDEATNRLRTDSATVLDGGDLKVQMSHTEDSVRLGDGTSFLTSTTIGPKIGLDVNILNTLNVEIDAADGDNIAIHDNEGDELEIETDGSINVNLQSFFSTTPTIANISAITSGTEYSYTFPTNTKKFMLKTRDSARLQFSYISGQSGTTYITVSSGSTYYLENLKLTSTTIYFQTNKNGETVEIESWS